MKDWTIENNNLCKIFYFNTFSEAFAFMTQVAMLCEQQQHHPSWSNTWNRVEIRLTTHDAGNSITKKDECLATAIDAIIKINK